MKKFAMVIVVSFAMLSMAASAFAEPNRKSTGNNPNPYVTHNPHSNPLFSMPPRARVEVDVHRKRTYTPGRYHRNRVYYHPPTVAHPPVFVPYYSYPHRYRYYGYGYGRGGIRVGGIRVQW